MYHSGDDDSYELVSGSLYSLIVEGNIDSYTCRDIFLNSSEYFSIQQGDMVAACWSGTNRVELFGRRQLPNSLVSGGQCSQEVIDETIINIRRALFLKAYISK